MHGTGLGTLAPSPVLLLFGAAREGSRCDPFSCILLR